MKIWGNMRRYMNINEIIRAIEDNKKLNTKQYKPNTN